MIRRTVKPDGAGILGSLTLGVVEVGGDGDDGMGDGLAKVRFSGLFHLRQNHGGSFFRRLHKGIRTVVERIESGEKKPHEVAELAFVLDLDGGLVILLDHLERPAKKCQRKE